MSREGVRVDEIDDQNGHPWFLCYGGFKDASEAFTYARRVKAVCEELAKTRRIPEWRERILLTLDFDLWHQEHSIEIDINEGPHEFADWFATRLMERVPGS